MKSYGKNIRIGLVVIAFIAVGLGIYYYFYERQAETPLLPGQLPEKDTLPPIGEKAPAGKEVPFIFLPALKDSDELVRQKVKDLSTFGKLSEWLKINDLIRRTTAAVDNVADGMSPRPHLKFLAPGKSFTVIKKGEKLYLNSQTYRRYDLAASAFASLDAGGAVRVFRMLKPLFQEAYRELGYPKKDFEETLILAMKELLDAPVVEGEIAVEEAVLSYRMIDDDLEDLSGAQKQLLRMGPQNTRKIQNKLREMALALGVPEKQLPKPQVYATQTK